jgi:excisionase family DNA binding protein
MNPLTQKLTVKIKEAAEILGISQSSIRRLIQRGEIRVCRKFRHPLVPIREIEKFLEATLQLNK